VPHQTQHFDGTAMCLKMHKEANRSQEKAEDNWSNERSESDADNRMFLAIRPPPITFPFRTLFYAFHILSGDCISSLTSYKTRDYRTLKLDPDSCHTIRPHNVTAAFPGASFSEVCNFAAGLGLKDIRASAIILFYLILVPVVFCTPQLPSATTPLSGVILLV